MPSLTVPMNPLCDVTFVAQMKKMPRGNDFENQHGIQDQDCNGGDMYIDHVPQPDHMGIPSRCATSGPSPLSRTTSMQPKT